MDTFYQNLINEVRHLENGDVLNQILDKKIYSPDGLFLEFGVGKGSTVNFIARKIYPLHVYGFDNFTGYPEPWRNFSIGSTQQLKMPDVEDNVILRKGLFKDSLPLFIDEICQNVSISFIHLDCGLYSSCSTILLGLKDLIKPGCVIVISDGMDYDNWTKDSLKAFNEFLLSNNYNYQLIGYNSTKHQLHQRIGFRIIEKNDTLQCRTVLNHIDKRQSDIILLYHQAKWIDMTLFYIGKNISMFRNIYIIYNRHENCSSSLKYLSKESRRKNNQKEIENLAFFHNLKNKLKDVAHFFITNSTDINDVKYKTINDILFNIFNKVQHDNLPCIFLQDSVLLFDDLCFSNLINYMYFDLNNQHIIIPNLINGGVVDYIHQRLNNDDNGITISKNHNKINRSVISRQIHSQVIDALTKCKDEITTECFSHYKNFSTYLTIDDEWEPIFFIFYPKYLKLINDNCFNEKNIGYFIKQWIKIKSPMVLGNAVAVNYCLPKQRADRFDPSDSIIKYYKRLIKIL